MPPPSGGQVSAGKAEPTASGPPPLAPFGLRLHRDGSWSHEGHPVTHERMRAAFDRGVRFLPEEGKYVVQLGRFRGEIELEEAAFFVRGFDAASGEIALSDGTRERLDPASLRRSAHDDALLCDVKRALVPAGLPARFTRAAQAELLLAAQETPEGAALRIGGRLHPLRGL